MFNPLYQNVVIRLRAHATQLESGLHLPENMLSKEKIKEGVIMAIGPGRLLQDGKTYPMQVKVGDRVVINEFVGTKHTIGESTFLFAKEDDIWCVITGDAPISIFMKHDRD